MSAERFLELVAERGLLDKKSVGDLRNQLRAKGPNQVSADQLAKLLVQKDRLTKFQAANLLEELARPRRDDEDVLELALDEDDDVTELEAIDVSPPSQDARSRPKSGRSPNAPSAPLPTLPSSSDLTALPHEDDGNGAGLIDDALSTSSFPAASDSRRRFGIGGWMNAFRGGGTKGQRPSFRWDSKLMLFGGGALFMILAFGALLYYQLSYGSGDELFATAEQEYTSQAYTQAIGKFEKYLQRFDGHPKNSLARIRIGLAKIRQQVESENWPAALGICQDELPKLVSEPSMEEARPELAGVLPQIYAGFVKRAEDARDVDEKEALLSSAAAAAEFVAKPEYLPASQRKGLADQLEQIEATVALIKRDIQRERQLTATVEKIEATVNSGDPVAAYGLRDELLASFPGLRNNSRLSAILDKVTVSEKERVTLDPATITPSTAATQEFPGRRVVLLDRKVQSPLPSQGVCYAAHQGGLLALSAADGSLLWRRWLGHGGRLEPRTVDGSSWSDVIAQDGASGDLLRLEARTGNLLWRIAPGAPIVDVRVDQGLVLAATDDRRLLVIDPATGTGRSVHLPQAVSVAAGVMSDPALLIQPALQSTLYVLKRDGLECVATCRVGHGSGTVAVPPAVLGRFVLVFENVGADSCWLHALALKGTAAEGLTAVGDPIRLSGNVHVSPAISGNRLLVATDRDAVGIFEIDPASPQDPPRKVAELVGSGKQSLDAFPLFRDNRILVAGRGLAQYQLQAANGRLIREAVDGRNDIHMSSPVWIGGEAIAQFTRGELADRLTVRATGVPDTAEKGKGEQEYWSTGCAPRLIQEPIPDPAHKGLICVGRDGALWQVSSEQLSTGICDRVSAPSLAGVVLGTPAALGSGRYLFPFTDGRPELLALDPAASGGVWRRVPLTIPHKRIVCGPVPWQKGVVVCTSEGAVILVDPSTGVPVAVPFQPPLGPGQSVPWIRPVPLPGTSQDLLVGTEEGRLFRLGAVSKEAERPPLLAELNLGPKLVGGMVSCGAVAAVVRREESGDRLVVLGGNGLEEKLTHALPERLEWGPERIGDMILLSTTDDHLCAFDGEGAARWTLEMPNGPLAGPPFPRGESLMLASMSGQLTRWNPRSGEAIPWQTADGPRDALDVGESLGARGLMVGERLLLTGRDAVLRLISLPE